MPFKNVHLTSEYVVNAIKLLLINKISPLNNSIKSCWAVKQMNYAKNLFLSLQIICIR